MSNVREEWRAVSGYEGLYDVSNRGSVRKPYNQDKGAPRGLKVFLKDGSLFVKLHRKGEQPTAIAIQDLVAAAFTITKKDLS